MMQIISLRDACSLALQFQKNGMLGYQSKRATMPLKYIWPDGSRCVFGSAMRAEMSVLIDEMEAEGRLEANNIETLIHRRLVSVPDNYKTGNQQHPTMAAYVQNLHDRLMSKRVIPGRPRPFQEHELTVALTELAAGRNPTIGEIYRLATALFQKS